MSLSPSRMRSEAKAENPRASACKGVKNLAAADIDSADDPCEFEKAITASFPNDEPLACHWYHPNLETFMPGLYFGKRKLMWDVANELVNRWAL